MTKPEEHKGITGRYIVAAVFADEKAAQRMIERLSEREFPLDSVSVLGPARSAGDDLLGIYYDSLGERIRAWGAHGAFWGGLWGLLAGGAGMFVVPGLGAVFAAGPIVEAIAAALAGATLAGGTMAGAAAISQLAVALHRLGVPEARLHALHEAIEQGHYVILLRCGQQEEAEHWRSELAWRGGEDAEVYPFVP